VYYGLVFILPRTLGDGEDDSDILPSLLIMNVAMIPSVILPCILVETK